MPRPGTFVGLLLGCDELSPNPLCRTVSMIEALPSQTPLSPVALSRIPSLLDLRARPSVDSSYVDYVGVVESTQLVS